MLATDLCITRWVKRSGSIQRANEHRDTRRIKKWCFGTRKSIEIRSLDTLHSLFKKQIIIRGEYFDGMAPVNTINPRYGVRKRIGLVWQRLVDYLMNKITYLPGECVKTISI